jgi:hypothetical protein
LPDQFCGAVSSTMTKFVAAIAGTLLSLTVINPAQAVTLTYDFNVDLQPGQSPFGQGSFSGFFSFNAPTTPNFTGQISVDPNQFFFNFGGPTFQLGSYFPAPTNAIFAGGEFLGIDTAFNAPPGQLPFVDPFGSQGFLTFYPSNITGSPFVVASLRAGIFWVEPVTYALRTPAPVEELPSTSIPEPSMLVGLSLLGLGVLFKKKRTPSQVAS